MPEWVRSDRDFWSAADRFERANGTTYREIELALPRELAPDKRRELVLGFVAEHIGEDHPYTLAIHNPKAAIERGEQPHAHIQFCERKLDGIERGWKQFFKRANGKDPENGGCAKDERWNGKDRAEHLEMLRKSWEQHVNRAYEQENRPERVSCKTLEAQGIERAPERHLGPKITRNREAVDLMKELREYQRELALIEWDRAALAAEIEQQKVGQSLSASPTAKVNSPDFDSPLQQPAFASYDEAIKFRESYIQARRSVIEEHYRKPLEQRQAAILLEVDRTRRDLEEATKARERAEGSWFKVGLAQKKEIEVEAKKAFWRARDESKDLEQRLQQVYPVEWAKANPELINQEIQKRLGHDCGERFKKASEMTARHLGQKAQHQELEKSLIHGKGRTGPDIGR